MTEERSAVDEHCEDSSSLTFILERSSTFLHNSSDNPGTFHLF